MKNKNKILTAFLLNLFFSIFELAGGFFVGSFAILSDALHDAADALSIGISYFLERKSNKSADEKYTYGYRRFSVIGGAVSTLVLIFGSAVVILSSAKRLVFPSEINYDGMIALSVVGVIVNSIAAFVTREGEGSNCRAVSLHMLEDVLGWGIVLFGAVMMRFTDISRIDPVLSLVSSSLILCHSAKNLVGVVGILTDKLPRGIDLADISGRILKIEGVCEVTHLHLRSLDGDEHEASVHIRVEAQNESIKLRIREMLSELGVVHATIEYETEHESEYKCAFQKEYQHAQTHCHAHNH